MENTINLHFLSNSKWARKKKLNFVKRIKSIKQTWKELKDGIWAVRTAKSAINNIV